MTLKVDLVRNAFYSTLANASSVLLLLLLILAGRFLGSEEFGKLTFAMALGVAFGSLADCGLAEITKRTLARDPKLASSYLGNILVWKLILSAGILILIVVTVNLLRADPATRMTAYLLGAASLVKTFKTLVLSCFQAFERYGLHAASQSAHNVSLLVCGGLALYSGAGIVGFAGVFLAVKLLDLLFVLVLLQYQITPISRRFDLSFVWAQQLQALPIGAYAVLVEFYWYVDTIMLGAIRGDVEVGWYGAAYKLFEAVIVFPIILCHSVSPQLSRLYQTDRADHRLLARRLVKYATMISILVTVVGVAVAGELITLLFGIEYRPGATSLQLLFCGFFFAFMHFVIHTLLISIDRQRGLVRLVLIALIANVAANSLLIPRFGLNGAAVATVMSESMICLFGYALLRQAGLTAGWFTLFWRPLLAGAIILGGYRLLGLPPRLVHVGIMVPAYTLLLLLLGAFDASEFARVRGLFRLKSG